MQKKLETQNRNILMHLIGKDSITSLEALDLYGSLRLAARIFDLRKAGHTISSTPHITTSGKRVAKYFYQGVNTTT